MELIEFTQKKPPLNNGQFLYQKQFTQQRSILAQDIQEKKNTKKHVQFNVHSPPPKLHIFENPVRRYENDDRAQILMSNDHDCFASTNSLAVASQDIKHKRSCSGRSIVVTIILVLVIIILSIGLGVGVGITKSHSSELQATEIMYQTAPMVTFMQSTVIMGNQTGPPCSTYTTVDDPSRNVAQITTIRSCDVGSPFNSSSGGSWIRFIGSGGTLVPTQSYGARRCGGFLSGWFNGTLPTTTGGIASGNMCLSTSSHDCLAATNASVMHCGGFYIYYLHPTPICNARYCTI